MPKKSHTYKANKLATLEGRPVKRFDDAELSEGLRRLLLENPRYAHLADSVKSGMKVVRYYCALMDVPRPEGIKVDISVENKTKANRKDIEFCEWMFEEVLRKEMEKEKQK